MSPSSKVGMLKANLPVVKRNAAVERLINLHFGSGETVAAGLRMNLQPLAAPLHNVVVADDALVGKAADAFEISGSRPPDGFGFARPASEAAIVVGDEAGQDAVGGIQIGCARQTEFAGEAILEHAPEAFDAAFGLRRLGGEEGDAELQQSAAELSGLALASELFVDRPVLVIAGEDAAAITVEGNGDAIAAQEAPEQVEIALRGFRGEELGGQDFAGGIVLHAQSGEMRAAALEPVVGRAVELNEFAFAGRAQAALTMSGRATFAWRADAVGTEQAA